MFISSGNNDPLLGLRVAASVKFINNIIEVSTSSSELALLLSSWFANISL